MSKAPAVQLTSRHEHFHHVADIGVRGYGATPATAFEQAALALTAVITDPDCIACHTPVQLTASAPDLELLLADWLNGLIYEMATRHMLFGRFEVRIDNTSLSATAWGEKVDIRRHRPSVEIKGATYTALAVRETEPGEWLAQCVVDV